MDPAILDMLGWQQYPIILGHEGGGIVEKVGPGVTELKAGTTGQFQATAGLTLKSDANVDIQGLNITAAANVKFEASGSMCKVAGTVQAELSGSASAVIRGGMVMIN